MYHGEIYGTFGPSCGDAAVIAAMIEAGMTGMRLNLSHTSLINSRAWIDALHEAAAQTRTAPALLIDMQGPELRIGRLNKPLTLAEGDRVLLGADGKADVPVAARIVRHLVQGDTMLLDDGRVKLRVTAVSGDAAVCRVLRGGKLLSHKSIKLVGKDIKGPVLTDQDIDNIRTAKSFGVSALMQPFVRSGEALKQIRKVLKDNAAENLRLFAKIENREGIRHLDDILPQADMIVIARGDLGNDMPLWELPVAQKKIAAKCRAAGKPFMVVTQMLASMTHAAVPTRAEVSDIANAVIDGASAVMVTGETAVGDHPVDVMRYLKNTADAAARYAERGNIKMPSRRP